MKRRIPAVACAAVVGLGNVAVGCSADEPPSRGDADASTDSEGTSSGKDNGDQR